MKEIDKIIENCKGDAVPRCQDACRAHIDINKYHPRLRDRNLSYKLNGQGEARCFIPEPQKPFSAFH